MTPFPPDLSFGPHPLGIRDMIQFRVEVKFLVDFLVIHECVQWTSQARHAGRDHVFDQGCSDERIERIASLLKDLLASITSFAVVGCDDDRLHQPSR